MKVLALVTDAYGGYGGIAQYNRDFLAAVGSAPGVTRVETLPRVAPHAVGQLPENVRQRKAILNRLFYSAGAIAAALQIRPDIVFSGHLYHGPLALLIAKATGARLISQLHGVEMWARLGNLNRGPLLASDLILTVSRDTLGRLRDRLVDAGRNGMVLANTVQPEFAPGDRAVARARFNLASDEQALLTVGRLDAHEKYKGHDKVIGMMRALRASGRNAIYLIAGVGDDRERLERLAAKEGVAAHVRFLGKVSHTDLPDLYRAADLFVLPSTGEGFGIAYLEAMACGTPALGLREGGAPDALGDGELGWCVEAAGLEAALVQALDAPRPDAQALHDAVQARFGQSVFRARVAALLQALQ